MLKNNPNFDFMKGLLSFSPNGSPALGLLTGVRVCGNSVCHRVSNICNNSAKTNQKMNWLVRQLRFCSSGRSRSRSGGALFGCSVEVPVNGLDQPGLGILAVGPIEARSRTLEYLSKILPRLPQGVNTNWGRTPRVSAGTCKEERCRMSAPAASAVDRRMAEQEGLPVRYETKKTERSPGRNDL
jgi:hypothetical protein